MKATVTDQLLAAVVRFSEDSIIITDTLLEHPGPRIIYVNPGFTRMTGYKPEEVFGKTPRLLQGPKTDQAMLNLLRSQLKRGQVFFGQAVNYRKDGSEFINEWHIEPIRSSNGKITHYIAIQRDVTQRVKQEQIIEQKNVALREILAQLEIEKKRLRDNILANVNDIIIPSLEKLKRKGTKFDKNYIDAMEQGLSQLTSSFGFKATSPLFKLSPKELEIAHLIRQGLTGKDIAKAINVSFKTIETHRFNIRKKLGLLNKGTNLTVYLQQMN